MIICPMKPYPLEFDGVNLKSLHVIANNIKSIPMTVFGYVKVQF